MWGVHTIFQAGASKDNGVKLQKIIDARIGVDNEINRRFETNGLNERISAFLNDCVQPVASAAESAVKKTGARAAAGRAPGSKRKKQGNYNVGLETIGVLVRPSFRTQNRDCADSIRFVWAVKNDGA